MNLRGSPILRRTWGCLSTKKKLLIAFIMPWAATTTLSGKGDFHLEPLQNLRVPCQAVRLDMGLRI